MFNVDLIIQNKNIALVNNTICEDLGFEQLKSILLENEYEEFIKVINKPLLNLEDIVERQRIIKDLLKYPNLAQDLADFASKTEQLSIQTNYVDITFLKPSSRLRMSMELLREYSAIFNKTLKLPIKLNQMLDEKTFESKMLNDLQNNVFDFNKLDEIVLVNDTILNSLFSRSLNVKIKFGSGFKLDKGSIIIKKGDKNVKIPKNNYYKFDKNFILENIVNEIYLKAALKQCSLIEQINKIILNLFNNLKVNINFYLSTLKIINFMDKNNLVFCFPKFLNDNTPKIIAKEVYDLTLATALKSTGANIEIVNNDFNYEQFKIFVVTGLNQGGKTTFLRSIGSAQLFAQSGIIVPAKEYLCTIFSSITSHFPKEEDDSYKYGKFKEELIRMKDNLNLLNGNSLLLFNEPFSSTTTQIGTEVMYDILKALSHTSSITIVVTHLYELAIKINELNAYITSSKKAINLVSTYYETKDKIERKYKIIVGEPQKSINIDNFYKTITAND